MTWDRGFAAEMLDDVLVSFGDDERMAMGRQPWETTVWTSIAP